MYFLLPFIAEWFVEIFIHIKHEVRKILFAQRYLVLSFVISENGFADFRNKVFANILITEEDLRRDRMAFTPKCSYGVHINDARENEKIGSIELVDEFH